jgi:hypothetical protein
MTNGSVHLMTWVPRDTKVRFAAYARAQGVSESALLKRLVVASISAAEIPIDVGAPLEPLPPSGRLSIRLRDDDILLLRERAQRRGLPASTYISFVVRSHLRRVAPIPDRELQALKHAIGEISAIGRNLNQIARIANHSGRLEGPSTASLAALLKACTALRDAMKDVINRNLESWEAGYERLPRPW